MTRHGSQGDNTNEVVADLMSEPEVWALRPILSQLLSGVDVGGPSSGPIGDKLRREGFLLTKSSMRLAITPARTLYVWGTTNQRRAFGSRLGDPSVHVIDTGRGLWSRLAQVRPVDYWQLGRRKRHLLRQILRLLDLTDRARERRVERILGRVLLEQHVLERACTRYAPHRVVVATQHSIPARVLVDVARRRGIPSVYVPHAPVANNRIYRDLPVDVAALRGPLEVEFYASLGVPTSHLEIVGNLALDVSTTAPPCPDGPTVVAPSPWPSERIEDFMGLVERGIQGPYVVCPHPRSDVSHLRQLLPARAKLVPGIRTSDLIAEGCRAVVQHSSGVAVEAMLLGAPVIDVLIDEEVPHYPAIAEPYVFMASSAHEIDRAITRAGAATRLAHVEQAREWASGWVQYTGREAEKRLSSLLASNIQPTGWLRDEWRSGML